MTYDLRADGALDYLPCRYGESKLLFRGPQKKAEGNYVAVLGGTETYGRFIQTPYPEALESYLGLTSINLGIVNAGVDAFLGDSTVMGLCKGAAATVIEITGAQNISNRFYAVHPRRNDRFLSASATLRSLFRDMEFVDVHFTRHLLAKLANDAPEKFQMVVADLKEAWVSRMATLIERIGGPVILLWVSDHRLGKSLEDPLIDRGPLFVDSAMVSALRSCAAGLVEVVADATELAEGYDEMCFSELDAAAAREILGPVVHRRAARRLAEAIESVLVQPA